MTSENTKITVIGTGPAAFAVLNSLILEGQKSQLDITIIGTNLDFYPSQLSQKDPRKWSRQEADNLNQGIKDQGAALFPPPRNHFGTLMDQWPTEGPGELLKTDTFGGLGNFWSCGVFPYTDKELIGWKCNHRDLEPYYEKIAELVGVSGNSDGLDSYYKNSNFVNRPPIYTRNLTTRLIQTIDKKISKSGIHFAAGVNRLALETRDSHDNSCVMCGSCMYGCFRNSLFRPGNEILNLAEKHNIKILNSRVESIKKIKGKNYILLNDGSEVDSDYIFLAAGAIGTTEIILRSYNIIENDVYIDDNENYIFPIFSFKKISDANEGYFGFGSAAIISTPQSNNGQSAFISVTDFPNYLIDYYLPQFISHRLHSLMSSMRERFLLARLQIDGATGTRYALKINKQGKLVIRRVRVGASNYNAKKTVSALRQVLKSSGFLIPRGILLRAATSAHYAGGLNSSIGNIQIDSNGRVDENVFVCDSSTAPYLPALPPTFTIMANAMRITTNALADINFKH